MSESDDITKEQRRKQLAAYWEKKNEEKKARRRERQKLHTKVCAKNYIQQGLCRACGGPREDKSVQHCDKCGKRRKRAWTLRLYGLTGSEYEELAAYQNWVCAICGKKETSKRGNLAVDHDHKTGKVRGLLCHKCNSGLGSFGDSPELLKSAINYLKLYSE